METPEKTRYTDEELQEFRTLILEKLQQAQASYEQLTAALEADESNPAYKVMEEGATTGTAANGIHQQTQSGTPANRQRNIRNLPNHRQTHS